MWGYAAKVCCVSKHPRELFLSVSYSRVQNIRRRIHKTNYPLCPVFILNFSHLFSSEQWLCVHTCTRYIIVGPTVPSLNTHTCYIDGESPEAPAINYHRPRTTASAASGWFTNSDLQRFESTIILIQVDQRLWVMQRACRSNVVYGTSTTTAYLELCNSNSDPVEQNLSYSNAACRTTCLASHFTACRTSIACTPCCTAGEHSRKAFRARC